MARLNAHRVDSRAMETGVWMPPGEEYGNLEFRVRGLTDAFWDAQAKMLRAAAMAYGGDAAKVPTARQREIRVECLNRYVLLDVRNLEDDAGQPVDIERFRGLLSDPDYMPYINAVVTAAALVGRVQAAEAETARGN